jgi:GNAT superfamily N-acetyltransferase
VDRRQQARRQGEELTTADRTGIRIRRARLPEAAALTELVLGSKAHWGYDAAFMALCVPELTVQPTAIAGGEVWVAEDGDGLAGVLEIAPDGAKAEIRLIFVAPERMRAGVGGALWQYAEARARALGADRIELDADPNAVAFYERMGMRVVGESPSGSIPGRMLPRMRKILMAGL